MTEMASYSGARIAGPAATRTLVLSGRLGWRPDHPDDPDILHLSTIEEPLVERLVEEMNGKVVTVRYWVTDRPIDEEEATRIVASLCTGVADGKFGDVYSEVTGYLWTDENLEVGGHDLASELDDARGPRDGPPRWLRIEVDIHEGEGGS